MTPGSKADWTKNTSTDLTRKCRVEVNLWFVLKGSQHKMEVFPDQEDRVNKF